MALSNALPSSLLVESHAKLRNLGTFERFRVTLHDLGYHNNVCLLATYTDVILTRHLLIHALECAIHEHPALSVQVTTTDHTKPFFVQLGSVDLDEVIEFIDVPVPTGERASWIDQFLSSQHSLGFEDKDKPLWRVVVLRNENTNETKISPTRSDIAFIWHHVIGDGKSGLAVHRTILQALASSSCSSQFLSASQGSEPARSKSKSCSHNAIIIPPRNELYPSLEEIFSMPASRSSIFDKFLALCFGSCLPLRKRSRIELDARKWSGASYQDQPPIKTLIRHITIPVASTKRLVLACRAKGTTITAFLQAIIAQTISRHYEHNGRLRCATAISMRRFMGPELGIGEQEMGLWVSAFHFELDSKDLSSADKGKNGLWDLARKNSKRIKLEIRKRDTDLGIGALRKIPDFRQNLKSKMGKKREDSFAVTNIGVFNGKLGPECVPAAVHGRPQIEKVVFSQSCHVNGSALQFCIMSVADGEMTIGVSWQEGIVSVKDTECITGALKVTLMQVSEE